MIWLKLAWRNIWRNKIRSGIQFMLICGSVYLGIVFHCLAFGNYKNMIDQAVRMGSGHVAIYDTLWFKTRKTSAVFDTKNIKRFLSNDSRVEKFYERLYIPAFVQRVSGGYPVNIISMDLKEEIPTHPLLKNLEWKPEGKEYVIIGKELAKKVGVSTNDRMVILARDFYGEVSGILVRVGRIVEFPLKEIDCCVIFADIDYIRDNLHYNGKSHEISIILRDMRVADKFSKEMNKTLIGSVKSYTWKESMKELVSAITIDYSGLILIMLFLYIIISVGTINVLFMSVMDRTTEIGVLRALGLDSKHINVMIFLEGLSLGGFSSLVGLILALITNIYLSTRGLDLSTLYRFVGGESWSYGGVMINPVIRSVWEWKGIVGYTVFIVILSGIASYFPARWINRLNVAEILRK